MLNNILIVFLVLTLGFGCSNNKNKIDREFMMSKEEIKKAKSFFRSSKNEILYMLMVDREGKVVKVQLLGFKDKKIEESIAIRFKAKVYQFKFYPAKPHEPDFREFFHPLDVESSVEFL